METNFVGFWSTIVSMPGCGKTNFSRFASFKGITANRSNILFYANETMIGEISAETINNSILAEVSAKVSNSITKDRKSGEENLVRFLLSHQLNYNIEANRTSSSQDSSGNSSLLFPVLDINFENLIFEIIENDQSSIEIWQLCLAFLYCLVETSAIILNIIIMLVLLNGFRCPLKSFVINLSISDIIMSSMSILTTSTDYFLGIWIFSGFFCSIVWVAVVLSVFVSAATITIVGFNRYRAIMYPAKGISNHLKLGKWEVHEMHLIAFIWILGSAISAPEYFTRNLDPICNAEEVHLACLQTWPDHIWIIPRYYLVIVCALPTVLLSYLYVRIGLKLWQQRRSNRLVPSGLIMAADEQKQVAVTSSLIVSVFIVSFFPVMTHWFLEEIKPASYDISDASLRLIHWLSKLYSCLKPFIFIFRSPHLREAVRNFLLRQNVAIQSGRQVSNPSGGSQVQQARSRPLGSSISSTFVRLYNLRPTYTFGGSLPRQL